MAVSSEYFTIDDFAFPDSSVTYFGIWTFAYYAISPITGAGSEALGYLVAGSRAQGFLIAGSRAQGFVTAGSREQGGIKS